MKLGMLKSAHTIALRLLGVVGTIKCLSACPLKMVLMVELFSRSLFMRTEWFNINCQD